MNRLQTKRPRCRNGRKKCDLGTVLLAMVAVLLLGCQGTSPIHLWHPPGIASIAGEPIVLMEISGPDETAAGLRAELIAKSAAVSGGPAGTERSARSLNLLLPEQLAAESSIQLVSGSDQGPSDLAIAAAARRAGVKYLLHGQIMHATGSPNSDERLSVVWRVVGIGDGATNEGRPISIDQTQIAQKYPDLMWVDDPQARLQQAMVRETLGLFSESVVRQQATLSHPRFTLGSAAVRRGNRAAQAGDWRAAEDLWVQTLERYPGQVSAWINAALAAAARQDFEQAKDRITRAIQWSAFSPLHRNLAQETLVWLELRQREYHEAFGLPDPPGGWRVTHHDD